MPTKYQRKSGNRTSTFLVIASEGVRTEVRYLEGLQRLHSNSRIKIVPLKRDISESGNSACLKVFESLDSARKSKKYSNSDEFFMVVDRDRCSTSELQLSGVAQSCASKGYHLVVSNPSIELWFLLHFKELGEYTAIERQLMFDNRDGYMKSTLRAAAGGSFNPSNPNVDKLWPLTQDAINRSKELDTSPLERWPNAISSRFYILLEKLGPFD